MMHPSIAPHMPLTCPQHPLPIQALDNRETLLRLHKNASRYKEALDEIQFVTELIQADAFDSVPQLGLSFPQCVHVYPWWDPPTHNKALLKGCVEMGYIPSSAARRSHVVGV